MTATRLDITIEQGADYDGFFQLDFDPTGYSAAMQIKLAAGYPSSLLTLTSDSGGLLIDGPNRRVYPVIPGPASAAIPGRKYVYDLKLLSPAGKTTRPFQGTVRISVQVTDIDLAILFGALLLESGGYFLLESGGVQLLEDIPPEGIPPEGSATLAAFQDGSNFLFQDGSTFQIS